MVSANPTYSTHAAKEHKARQQKAATIFVNPGFVEQHLAVADFCNRKKQNVTVQRNQWSSSLLRKCLMSLKASTKLY